MSILCESNTVESTRESIHCIVQFERQASPRLPHQASIFGDLQLSLICQALLSGCLREWAWNSKILKDSGPLSEFQTEAAWSEPPTNVEIRRESNSLPELRSRSIRLISLIRMFDLMTRRWLMNHLSERAPWAPGLADYSNFWLYLQISAMADTIQWIVSNE